MVLVQADQAGVDAAAQRQEERRGGQVDRQLPQMLLPLAPLVLQPRPLPVVIERILHPFKQVVLAKCSILLEPVRQLAVARVVEVQGDPEAEEAVEAVRPQVAAVEERQTHGEHALFLLARAW